MNQQCRYVGNRHSIDFDEMFQCTSFYALDNGLPENPLLVGFDCGCHILFSLNQGTIFEPFSYTIYETKSNTILYEDTITMDKLGESGHYEYRTPYYYYIEYTIAVVNSKGERNVYTYSIKNEEEPVLFDMSVAALGDNFAWFPYLYKFIKQMNIQQPYILMNKLILELVEKQYPELHLYTPEQFRDELMTSMKFKSIYLMGTHDDIHMEGFKDVHVTNKVCFKSVGINKMMAYYFGLNPFEKPEKVRLDLTAERQVPEKYVVIATQSTGQHKHWMYPNGWEAIVEYLKQNGYRVIDIDAEINHVCNYVQNKVPHNAELAVGMDIPLQDRINLIKDADFFIGLSSGLSWVADACNVPVVMISGFSADFNEFETPYRVINYFVCNSCENDITTINPCTDVLWCPKYKGTDRMYECSTRITPELVISVMEPLVKKE